jgi:arsenical-resistance protein 2
MLASIAKMLDIQSWLQSSPAPKHTDPVYVDRSEVLKRLNDASDHGYVILDVRGDDFTATPHIRGAINIPAQHFLPSAKGIYGLADGAKKDTIYVHCRSSAMRACRVWGYLADVQEEVGGKATPKIITGGINSWIDGGAEYHKVLEPTS